MNTLLAKPPEPSPLKPDLHLESDFFATADVLRGQFERLMSISVPANNGLTPFCYAFCQNGYQFLTASAERIFEPDILEDLIDALRAWANRALGVSHVSTPQFRIYIEGCSRNLLCDDVSAPWRYALSLTKNVRPRRTGPMNVLTHNASPKGNRDLSIRELMNSHLSFNQLLVHRTTNPYSIDTSRISRDPLEGIVFLDGYLW